MGPVVEEVAEPGMACPLGTPPDTQRARRIEAFRYETDLARRRFFEVDPANRLVAASLEANWNERLRDLEEACREREARGAARDTELSERQVERSRELARDFERVWNAAQTGNADRKRLLGLLIGADFRPVRPGPARHVS